MITIEDTADRYERKTIRANLSADDKSSLFMISLLTKDIPHKFEDTRQRKLEVSIIDGHTSEIEVPTNSIVMPVTLSAVSNVEDHLRAYYTNCDNVSAGIAPQLQLNGYVDFEAGSKLPQNPHILITFGAQTENGDNNMDNNIDRQQIDGGTQSQGLDLTNVSGYDPRRHVDENENANGGLDLPVGERKSDIKQEERENQTFNYDTPSGKPEVVDA